ncbi:MAG: hypothetical protein E3J87_07130 [Candidatus Cloacimonadota bacterium]|nr:MAG: hypothetical protein E3J87_07130 [Candidatus Cloacimonadota bacterium]
MSYTVEKLRKLWLEGSMGQKDGKFPHEVAVKIDECLFALEKELHETSLGTSAISKNCQTYIIPEARPHLNIKRGELCRIEFVLVDGKVFIRKNKK